MNGPLIDCGIDGPGGLGAEIVGMGSPPQSQHCPENIFIRLDFGVKVYNIPLY